MDDYIGIVAICGDEGTCKTTMALTFPKPLSHFDIDVGGYRRAAWRMNTEGMTTKSYPRPIQIDKLLGQQAQGAGTSISVRFPKKVEGMKELWQQIVMDFVTVCQDEASRTIVLDSSTLLWNIDHNSVLQEAQERQLVKHKKEYPNRPFDENDFRERLQPIEYGPANDKMRTLLHTARSFRKNLVLVHYPTDEYGTIPDGRGGFMEGKTGNIIIDGFKETKKLVDLIVWTSIKETVQQGGIVEKQPIAKITKCGIEGMGLSAVGMEVPATYEGIINLRNLMRGGQPNA